MILAIPRAPNCIATVFKFRIGENKTIALLVAIDALGGVFSFFSFPVLFWREFEFELLYWDGNGMFHIMVSGSKIDSCDGRVRTGLE